MQEHLTRLKAAGQTVVALTERAEQAATQIALDAALYELVDAVQEKPMSPQPGPSLAALDGAAPRGQVRVITSDKLVLCQPRGVKSLDFLDTLQPPLKTPGNTGLQAGQLAAPGVC